MNTRRLGRTDLQVSVIGAGTNQLRRVPERQAIDTLRRAFELGVNLVNLEPEYEGVEEILRTVLREIDQPERILISMQAGGDAAAFERTLETTCEKLGRERLDLFGISSISEQEIYGANVWGAGGLVDVLQRKKGEGRVRVIYASEHGSPEQMKALLERNVFDALLLAYNPLGFHLVTFRAETVFRFETPPAGLKGTYVREDLSRTATEILPLAKEKGVGVMLMKPLAGGLLCSGKAFRSLPWRPDLPPPPEAPDVLRYLLADDAIACVVPGMASVEEVEENAAVGTGDLALSRERAALVENRTRALRGVLCSRCGYCDDLCSQRLPVSFAFRAAYHYLYPTAPFGISSTLQYFKLHPWEQSVCATCPDQTCRCPSGIDIRREMTQIHAKMLDLRTRGLVPPADNEARDWATGRAYSSKVLSREIPSGLSPRESATVRLQVRNTGTRTWYREAIDGRSTVALKVDLDRKPLPAVFLRRDVHPTEDCHFAFSVEGPRSPGTHVLTMRLFDRTEGPFPDDASPALREEIVVTAGGLTVELDPTNEAISRRIDDLKAQVELLKTGRVALRHVLRAILRRLGLSDLAYRHHRILVPLFNAVFRDRWTPYFLAETARRAEPEALVAAPLDAAMEPATPPDMAATAAATAVSEVQPQLPPKPAQEALPSEPPSAPAQETLSARYLDHNVPDECAAGSACVFRVLVENTGSATWLADAPDGRSFGMCLFIDGEFAGSGGPVQPVVKPGEQVSIPITATLPDRPGTCGFRFDLLVQNTAWFSKLGLQPLELTVRLAERTRTRTEELLSISARRHRWYFSPAQGVHRSGGAPRYPVFGESAAGCRITDVDGRRFLDVLMGWGTHLLGYSNERIQKALARSLTSGSGVLSLPHRLEMEVAEALCAGFPFGDEVLFGKNGSDVTTWAVRTARIATGRKTALFAGYHGWQDWYVATQGFAPTGVPSGNNPYNILLPYRDTAVLEEAVAAHGRDLAAILVEPAATDIDLDDPHHERDGAYLKRAEQLAREHGALFLLDEIMTGFRFRSGSAQAAYGLTPDLTCLGKALANGHSLSALVGRESLLKKHAARIYYAPTMKGEVSAYAAALEALKIYREEDVPAAVWATGDRIREGVDATCRELGLQASLLGSPYRMYFHFRDLPDERNVFCRTLLQQELTRHGILSNKGYVILSAAHDAAAVEECVAGFGAALGTVREALGSDAPIRFLDIPDVIMETRSVSRVFPPGEGASSDQSSDDGPCPASPVAGPDTLLSRELRERRVTLQSLPATIDIELTARCSFKPPCVFCAGKNAPGYREPPDLSAEALGRYWPYLLGSQRVNDCSYGEPLLYPGFRDLIERLASANVKFGFTTNGFLLDEAMSRFLVEHAEHVKLAVSVDAATPETYFALHGQDLRILLERTGRFRALHEEHRPGGGLPLLLSYIAMRSNVGEVPEFLRMAKRLGVRAVMLRNLFDLKAGDYTCQNFGHSFVYADEILSFREYTELEEKIRKEEEFDGLDIQCAWNERESFLAEQAEQGVDLPCLFPWKFLCIRPIHDIYTPCAFLKKGIAAPSKTSVEEVWNGPTIVGMRRALLDRKIPDFCLEFGVCPLVLGLRESGGEAA